MASHPPHGPDPTPTPPDAAPADALCRIATVLDALQCGALLVHRTGRVTHVNPRLSQMLRRETADLLDRSLFNLYRDDPGRAAVRDALDRFDESREHESYLPLPDGARLPVILAGRRLVGPPPLCDYRIVTVIDISQQKQTEQNLQQRYVDIAQLSDTVLEQALALKRHAQELEARVRARTHELHEANMDAIYMLAVASEAKDQDTGAHVRRIEHYTRLLALELGHSSADAERLAYSAILHDVGKIQIPDEILRKPAALTKDEWHIMRQHTLFGERILSRAAFFDIARQIARSHHENWDGSGYPDHLTAADIPLPARIVHVADVYDALTTARPYKTAWTSAAAAAEIEKGQHRAFDPAAVEAFLQLLHSGRLTPPPTRSARPDRS